MNGHTTAEAALVPLLVRLFLRQEFGKIDPTLPGLLQELTDVGAGECWHKKSTFKEHLYRVYLMLKVWGQNDVISKCGLLHSAYSNSYVNLAIFKPEVERSRVQGLVGQECEELIHLFCVVPRHDLIYTQLLDQIGDGPMVAPKDGLVVKHIKTGDPLHIDLATLAQFLVMTMVDFAEQVFSWQDDMFENTDGRLRYSGNSPQQLWPGEAKPGRWMSAVSRMGAVLKDAFSQLQASGADVKGVVLPAVFDHCSTVLSEADELSARDDYWRVVTTLRGPEQQTEALQLLGRCVAANPFIAEPHLLAAQIHMHRRQWDEAAAHAREALRLFCTWGTAWDKRLGWEVWIAYTRVVLQQARQQTWPTTPFGMLNVGLVDGI